MNPRDSGALPPSSPALDPCGGRPSALPPSVPAAHPSQPLSPQSLGSQQLLGDRGSPATFPALPDGVGDTLDTDAVTRLCRSLHLAHVPAAAAPLQGRRAPTRHSAALGPHGLPPSGCWPGARGCHHHVPLGAGQGAPCCPRVGAGHYPQYLPPGEAPK